MNPRIAMFGVVGALVMFIAGCWVESVKYREQARYERMIRLLRTPPPPVRPGQ